MQSCKDPVFKRNYSMTFYITLPVNLCATVTKHLPFILYCGPKKHAMLFWTITLGDFYTFCISANKNKYSSQRQSCVPWKLYILQNSAI